MKRIIFLLLLCCWMNVLEAQDENFTYFSPNSAVIGLEYRPRAEFRSGYADLKLASDQPVGIVSQRLRFNTSFNWNNLYFKSSVQDVRIWGEQDPRALEGGVSIYEGFFGYQFQNKSHFLQIGRQRIKIDDERLFAENNWRQAGGKHDALLIQNGFKKWTSKTYVAYNQNTNNNLNASYTPDFDWYQFLVLNHTEINLRHNLSLKLTNFVDGYQNESNLAVYAKSTNGAKVAYQNGPFKYEVEGYYQFGKIKSGLDHNAYMLHSSLHFKLNQHSFTLGSEYLSGTNQAKVGIESNSFLSQYRAFHGHNGIMDYNLRLMSTENHVGLADFYFNQAYRVHSKAMLFVDYHAFFNTSTQYKNRLGTEVLKPYWGSEIDLYTEIDLDESLVLELAYNVMFANETRSILHGGNANVFQQFAYVELTFTPTLWSKSNAITLLEVDE